MISLATAGLTTGVAAQSPDATGPLSEVPSGLVALETERSRSCVDVFARVDALDQVLLPLAERTQRLLAIGEAIALEDTGVVATLDAEDPLEAQVAAWFATDAELAQRYVATLAQQLVDQRTAARTAIKQTVSDALLALQDEANSAIENSGDLVERADQCDGAVFVRSAVLEACATGSGPLCDEARESPALPQDRRFRFVDTAEALWDIQEFRPWTTPSGIGVTQDGQLDGARTIGYARVGNVVVTVAFSPLVRERANLEPGEADRFQVTNDSLGFTFSHPDIVYTPALGLRATLPNPLGDETEYVLHFGTAEDGDVLWTGPAATGALIEASVQLRAGHVRKLQSGEPITFTALRPEAAGDDTTAFAIELTSVNQAQASGALVGYLADQFGRDLTALLQTRGSD